MATSVPVPIAMPRSACASAGASLTPSPTAATTSPRRWSSATTAALPSGITPATTSSMPTSAATALATGSASPVIRIGRRPRRRSSATARALVGLTRSATAIRAVGTPSTRTSTAVRPAARASADAWARGPSTAGRPTSTVRPPTRALTPRPARLANRSTSGRVPLPGRAASAIARAMGCSLPDSAAPARASAASRRVPGTATTSTTSIAPWVRVPVLSRTVAVARRASSRIRGPLISTPSCAPRPVPTISAVGVARPSAHGR